MEKAQKRSNFHLKAHNEYLQAATVFLNPTKCVEPFEPSMDKLVQEGAWRMLNRKLAPDYFKGIEGVLHTLQKSL